MTVRTNLFFIISIFVKIFHLIAGNVKLAMALDKKSKDHQSNLDSFLFGPK